MTDEDKMFNIGVSALCIVGLLTLVLQVCYRTQNRSLKSVGEQIVSVQKQIALKQVDFESKIRSEYLEGMLVAINPNSEIIGFKKYVSIDDIKMKE